MATDGVGFAITLGIYTTVLLGIFIGFSVWRRLPFTRKFYAPKRHAQAPGRARPARLPRSFGGWVGGVLRAGESELVRTAGVDATMYIKILRMGFELFLGVSLISCAIILPINLTGGEVDRLMAAGGGLDPSQTSPYMFWLPSPSPAPAAESGSDSSQGPPKPVAPPPIYAAVPEAPPGTTWWAYLPGVPPLPPPPPGISGWKYDDAYSVVSYELSNLDKTTMSNIAARSSLLYAHAVVAWAVTAYSLWIFWRYCRVALRLRMFHLLNAPAGGESHAVLVTDVPGVAAGTVPARLDATLLRLVPRSVKARAYGQLGKLRGKTAADLLARASPADAHANPAAPAAAAADAAAAPGTPAAGEAAAVPASPASSGGGGGVGGGGIESLEGWAPPDRWADACALLREAGVGPGEAVAAEFRAIYKDDLSHVHMAYDTTALDALVARYAALKRTASDAVDDVVARRRRGAPIKPRRALAVGVNLGAWGREKYGARPKRVDAWEYYVDVLGHLRGEVGAAQAAARLRCFPSAFVTFRRRAAQVVAANALMSEDLTAWRCQGAPGPDEIIWGNLGMRGWERSARTALMVAAFWALACFYLIPVTAVQALLSTNSLVDFINDIPILNALVTSILPSLALKIFLALLPWLLTLMARFSGMVSQAQVDFSVVSRFYIFQVVTVFLGSLVAGSLANQFQQLLDDPSSIVTILGTAAPQSAIFFMTYLLLQALLTTPLALLRLGPLVVFWLRTRMAATERQRARLWGNNQTLYGTVIPNDTMAILLGLSFSIICPLIAPVAVLYFATAYVACKYNSVYVNMESYQSGGLVWLRVFDQCVAGLVIAQITLIALLGIKKMVAPPLIALPLPFITLLFASAAHSTFWPPMRTLSLMAAADRDAREAAAAEGAGAAAVDREVAERYVSPSFKIDDVEHAQLMSQLAVVRACQAAGDYSGLAALEEEDDLEGGKLAGGAGTDADTEAGDSDADVPASRGGAAAAPTSASVGLASAPPPESAAASGSAAAAAAAGAGGGPSAELHHFTRRPAGPDPGSAV